MNCKHCPERACRSQAIRSYILSALLCIALLAPGAWARCQTVKIADVGDFGLAGQPEADVANLIKSWSPTAVITNGDNNYPSGASSTIDANIGQYYHQYIYPYKGKYGAGAKSNLFWPCVGNHDWGDKYPNPSGLNPYLSYFTLPNNERYYDFVIGPVHFFSLDSDQNEPDGNTVTSKQAVWLKGKLAAATEPWKIVYFHHPPYTSSQFPEDVTTNMQWPFQQWGASVVIAGHVHNYERIMQNGFPYFINGIGGNPEIADWGTIAQGSVVRYNGDFGAMRITASPTSITFDEITRMGLLVDTLTLTKGAPTNLSAAAADRQVSLSWTGVNGATSYNVKRATTPGGPYTTIGSTTSSSYTDTGLTDGTTYYYVVSANTSSGESGNSNEASAIPQPPGLRINCGGGTYNGTTGTFVADTDFTSGFNWSYSTRTIGNTNDPALYLDVRASDTSLSYSLPAASGNYNLSLYFAECTFTAAGQRLMNISVNGSPVKTNFDIFAAAGGANRAVILSIPVSSVNGQVNLTIASALSSSGAVIAAIELDPSSGGQTGPPAAPSGLTGTPGTLSASLGWQASTGATSYSVKRSGVSGGPYTTLATGVTTTSYTDGSLTAGTTYYYVVTASNASGESGNSNEVAVTPQAQSLPAPTNLAAIAGNKQAGLTWTASSGATGYSVLRGTTSGGPYTAVGQTAATSYTDTGLANGTTYYYVVRATNGSSQSGSSNQASVVPNGVTLRINAGGSAYSGTLGSFVADTDFSGGFLWSYSSRTISGTSDPALYLAVRASDTNFSYSLPVPSGSYTLNLHFAECTYSAANQRLMNIAVNGTQVLSNFDIFATAGAMNKAVVKSLQVNATGGAINLTVTSALTSSGAVLAAIEVIPN
ncbi:MAG TPA: malectin domain-containing carbohydrate-binding protein [Chthonomonadaceae bacterium]|nr:malectin domain-containing carbohydrate-binding protein [Chthonomonadaceae bacterium]